MLHFRPRLAIAVMTTMLLASTSAFAATPANTLVMAKNIDDMISLDPAEAYELSGIEIDTNVYDRIMRFEAEDVTKLVGGVAESWSVSDDGKTFTFKLKPGLKFHSGNPVTAEDADSHHGELRQAGLQGGRNTSAARIARHQVFQDSETRIQTVDEVVAAVQCVIDGFDA